MKKFILLFVLFFTTFLNFSLMKSVNEDNDSLILLITDENDENYFTSLPLHQLKKCTFPTGPQRDNTVSCNDFKKISSSIVEQIKDSIENKEYTGLTLFCIDSESKGIKCKTCGFSVPEKEELCYVFKFELPLKETRAAVVTNEQLNDILIEIETSNIPSDENLPEVNQPNSKMKKILQEIAITIFVNYVEMIEKCKISFDKCKSSFEGFKLSINNYLKNNLCISKNMNLQFISNFKTKLS